MNKVNIVFIFVLINELYKNLILIYKDNKFLYHTLKEI